MSFQQLVKVVQQQDDERKKKFLNDDGDNYIMIWLKVNFLFIYIWIQINHSFVLVHFNSSLPIQSLLLPNNNQMDNDSSLLNLKSNQNQRFDFYLHFPLTCL